MAAKARKDKKGYALRTGECQRKDGRYSYSYTDCLETLSCSASCSCVDSLFLRSAISFSANSICVPPFDFIISRNLKALYLLA